MPGVDCPLPDEGITAEEVEETLGPNREEFADIMKTLRAQLTKLKRTGYLYNSTDGNEIDPELAADIDNTYDVSQVIPAPQHLTGLMTV